MTTIVLADDHNVVRQGLRAVLEAEPDFTIIGEADDGLDVIKLVEQLMPDILIVDVMLPGVNGLEVTRQVREHVPGTRVIILSMYANEAYVLEALRYGAAAYVLKRADATDLVRAVHEVLLGHRYLSPPLSERAIDMYVQKAQESAADTYATLTPREREVLHLIAQGHSSTAIAERLVISPRTAEAHRTNLMRKLELQSQTDLIKYALRRGIIPFEE